jgi:hypothetical protein
VSHRELYEAYVILSLHRLMLEFLGPEDAVASRLAAHGSHVKHLPPCCCAPKWRLGAAFLHRTRVGTFQYVLVRITTAIIALVLQGVGLYDEGDFHAADRGYVYLVVVVNLSQAYAMYCLVMFYKALKHDLAPLKPLGKFMVVKAVVVSAAS